MKFFAIFATILAVTCALPRQWTIHELSEALQNPNTDPIMIPVLEAALNDLMVEAMGAQPAHVEVSMTLHEISTALQDPHTDIELVPYLEDALNSIMDNIMNGNQQSSIVVAIPASLVPAGGIVAPTPVVVPTTPVVELSMTLNELSDAIQNPSTDPALIPYLESALNSMMASLMAGNQPGAITVTVPASLMPAEGTVVATPVVVPTIPVVELSMSLNELSDAIQNPSTDPALIPYLENALNSMMASVMAGNQPGTIIVGFPANLLPAEGIINPSPVVSPTPVTPTQEMPWTLHELSEAIQDPSTDPALIPYLTDALNIMMASLMAGNQPDSIMVAIPVDLLPAVVAPAPVVVAPSPVAPSPVAPSPVAPTPVEAPTASAPLVQIIVNVNQQEAPVIPSPVLVPSPVVVPTPVEVPTPVDIIPGPVNIVDSAAPEAINPVDVIAINPPQINPVDVIAIAAPEINPIDIAHPIPVVPVGVAGIVGPIL